MASSNEIKSDNGRVNFNLPNWGTFAAPANSPLQVSISTIAGHRITTQMGVTQKTLHAPATIPATRFPRSIPPRPKAAQAFPPQSKNPSQRAQKLQNALGLPSFNRKSTSKAQSLRRPFPSEGLPTDATATYNEVRPMSSSVQPIAAQPTLLPKRVARASKPAKKTKKSRKATLSANPAPRKPPQAPANRKRKVHGPESGFEEDPQPQTKRRKGNTNPELQGFAIGVDLGHAITGNTKTSSQKPTNVVKPARRRLASRSAFKAAAYKQSLLEPKLESEDEDAFIRRGRKQRVTAAVEEDPEDDDDSDSEPLAQRKLRSEHEAAQKQERKHGIVENKKIKQDSAVPLSSAQASVEKPKKKLKFVFAAMFKGTDLGKGWAE